MRTDLGSAAIALVVDGLPRLPGLSTRPSGVPRRLADFEALQDRMLRLYSLGRLPWPQIIPIRGWRPGAYEQ